MSYDILYTFSWGGGGGGRRAPPGYSSARKIPISLRLRDNKNYLDETGAVLRKVILLTLSQQVQYLSLLRDNNFTKETAIKALKKFIISQYLPKNIYM